MIYLINYADENYQEAQHYCSQMARARGGFDKVIEYHPNDIDDAVINLCPEGIYGNNRKAKRYGLWRPYIIKKTLDEIQYGDYLCYCDAGGYFIRNVVPLIKRMEKKNQDIRVSVLPLLEKQWTKRDVFLYFDADYPDVTDSNQICSTFIFIKKTKRSVAFFEQYFQISKDMPILFTDAENVLGKDNYPEYIENRHNQSVLSILCKVHNIKPDTDISEYGLHQKLYSYTPGVIYKPCLPLREFPYYISHRRPKVDLLVHICNVLRIFLPSNIFMVILKSVLYLHERKKKQ